MYISPEAKTIVSIILFCVAVVTVTFIVMSLITTTVTKFLIWLKTPSTSGGGDLRTAMLLQELTDKMKELSSEPARPPNQASPRKPPPKPVDPNDIQISGPIPIIGSEEDVSQSKTQPIPVLSGEASETKVLQIQDHILESFYRKLADPKTYDWSCIPEDARIRFNPSRGIIFEPYVPYDTNDIAPKLVEMMYFMIPMGQCGKTQLETNLQMGSCLSYAPMGDFAHQTTVIRFIGNASKDDIKNVLESGLYELLDCSTHMLAVQSPLSSFVPLNPFDQDPKVFFLTHKTVFVREYHCVNGFVRFPHGLGPPMGLFKLKIELPGLKMRPNWSR